MSFSRLIKFIALVLAVLFGVTIQYTLVDRGKNEGGTMTANQIAYWNLQENVRANQAKEAENYRSNKAKEDENYRSNVARETETNRSNVKQEFLKNDIQQAQKTNLGFQDAKLATGAIKDLTGSAKDVTEAIKNVNPLNSIMDMLKIGNLLKKGG